MNIKSILSMKSRWKTWVKIIILQSIIIALSLAPMKLIEKLIDGNSKGTGFIVTLGLIIFAIYVVSPIIKRKVRLFIKSFSLDLSSQIRKTVYTNLLNVKYETYNNLTKSNRSDTIVEDCRIISENTIEPKVSMIDSLISFIFSFALIYSISPWLILVLLVIGLGSTALTKYFQKRMQETISDTRESNAVLWNKFSSLFSYWTQIKANQREKLYSGLFDAADYKYTLDTMRELKVDESLNMFDSMLFMGTISILYTISSLLVHSGQMTIGGLVAILMYNSILIDPLIQLQSVIRKNIKVNVSIDRITFLDKQEDLVVASDLDKFVTLEFKNVSYETDGKYVLKDINFRFEQGSRIGIVGKSGSGKTTILKLLLGFIQPTSGKILFNGHEVNGISLRSLISLMQQDSEIITTTLKDNLMLYSDKDLLGNEITSIIEIDTLKDRNFGTLSGGEKKKVILTSMLNRDASIYIFDELSNSLDNESIKNITDILQTYLSKKTVILIDHKMSVVKNMEKILFVENGKVIDYNTHENLMNNEAYANLYNLELGASKQKSK